MTGQAGEPHRQLLAEPTRFPLSSSWTNSEGDGKCGHGFMAAAPGAEPAPITQKKPRFGGAFFIGVDPDRAFAPFPRRRDCAKGPRFQRICSGKSAGDTPSRASLGPLDLIRASRCFA